MAVLRGASQVLDRFSPTIVVEIDYAAREGSGQEIEEGSRFLTGRGYRFYRLNRVGRPQPTDSSIPLPAGNLICMR
jgi:hypothetical protein